MKYTALAAFAAAGAAQAHLADQLELRVAVTNNNMGGPWPIPPESSALGADWGFFNNVTVTVSNKGTAHAGKDWELFFSTPRRVLAVNDDRFKVEQLTGDLYKLTPTAKFDGFPANGHVTIPLTWEYWLLQATDFMPRWYVSAGGVAKVIANTNSNNIADYADAVPETLYKRSGGDANVYQKPFTRYAVNAAVATSDATAKVLPTPLQLTVNAGAATIAAGVKISAPALPAASVSALEGRFATLGLATNGAYPITVAVGGDLPAAAQKVEGYVVEVTPTGATVRGFDAAGAFYGVQSIAALVTVGAPTIPTVTIVDALRFAYRGQHADIARNFHGKETLLKLLDQMAAYKLNKFLLHASDDEGWRIEIDGLPELTSVGAARCHDPSETACLLPQLGSGPTGSALYLSKADYVEVVRAAAARFIEVVPEIDMPGHARAAVVAMEARFKATGDETYRLLDDKDESALATIQYYNRLSLANPCRPSTFAFVDKVMGEIKKLHDQAGAPLRTWSFGADEAKNAIKGVANDWPMTDTFPIWAINNTVSTAPTMRPQLDAPFAKSPLCVAKYGQDPALDKKALRDLAVGVDAIAKQHGVTSLQAWSDGLLHAADGPKPTLPTRGMVWDALFWGTSAHELHAKGYGTISANPDFTYFDMPHESHPDERGYYWASRATGLKRVFSFAPVNLYQNAETAVSRDNTPYELTTPTGYQAASVAGTQGHVWTETVRTAQEFDHMAFPRMLALAERAWHQAAFELQLADGVTFSGSSHHVNRTLLDQEFGAFVSALGKELPKLDRAGVDYRVAPAGARIVDGRLVAAAEAPGLRVQYRAEGGVFADVPREGVAVAGKVEVRTVTADGKRASRVETIAPVCISQVPHITADWCSANSCPTGPCLLVDPSDPHPSRTCRARTDVALASGVDDKWCQATLCADAKVCQWVSRV